MNRMPKSRAADAPRFAGFGVDLPEFYAELARNNNRDWWQLNRGRYESLVAGPMELLAAELEPEFGPTRIFRPYRDVRFSADKRPLQEHASLSAMADWGAGCYLSVGADGLLLGGGSWHPERESLQRFRAVVDDPTAVVELKSLLARLRKAGFELATEERLAGAPRGFPRDHPEIELLRQTNLAVFRSYDVAAWLSQRRCLKVIVDGWRVVCEWNDWLRPVTSSSGGARHG